MLLVLAVAGLALGITPSALGAAGRSRRGGAPSPAGAAVGMSGARRGGGEPAWRRSRAACPVDSSMPHGVQVVSGEDAVGDVPPMLFAAIEKGQLTQAQLRGLITLEARALGLTFHEAVQRATARTLPRRDPISLDLELLVALLPA